MVGLPLVSVVMPVYNGAHYVGEAIESVLSQTYGKYEILVIDDGSTDDTRKRVEPYLKNPSVRYVYRDNGGNGAARNTGIEFSRGEYLCFLDHDDLLEPGSIETRLRVYQEHPELGLVCSDFRKLFMNENQQRVTYSDGILRKFGYPSRFPRSSIDVKTDDLFIMNAGILLDLVLDCFVWTGTVMVRKEVFWKVGLFDERTKWSEDHDMWVRIARSYPIGFLDTVTAVYRRHAHNISLDWQAYDLAIKFRVSYLDSEHELKSRDRNRLKVDIAEYYFYIGRSFIGTIRHFIAKRKLLRAIQWDPFRLKYYAYFLVAMLPSRIGIVLRKVKGTAAGSAKSL